MFVSLVAEAGDQAGEERAEAEQAEQRENGSCLRQSIRVALSLIGSVCVGSVLICAGRALISSLASRAAAGCALRILIGSWSRSGRSRAALSVLIRRARRVGRCGRTGSRSS